MTVGGDVLARLDFLANDPGDPVEWVETRLGETMWSRQADIARAVRQHRRVAVPSANSTGKSWGASRLAAWWIDTHPVGTAFVLTTAPTQPQVDAILWRELRHAHTAGDLRGRLTSGAIPTWRVGDELFAMGRKSADYTDPEQAAAAFQGLHAQFLLVLIDEAAGVPDWLWDAIESSAISTESRVLALGNPTDPETRFADVCKPGSGWHTLHVSAFDCPAFTGENVPSHVAQGLANPQSVDQMRRTWGEGSPRWKARVEGQFPDEAEDALILRSWVEAAQKRSLPLDQPGSPKVFGCDVARSGSDATTVYENRGGRIRRRHYRRGDDLMATVDAIRGLQREPHAFVPPAIVDANGIGAGVFDRLVQQGSSALAFVGSERAERPDRFVNRRAECFWWLREALREGLVDLDPEDEELAQELLALRYGEDRSGRVQIERKDQLRGRLRRSPDRADAVAMTFHRHLWRPLRLEAVQRRAIEDAYARVDAARWRRMGGEEWIAAWARGEVPRGGGSVVGDIMNRPM